MQSLAAALGRGKWGLVRARAEAGKMVGSQRVLRQLVAALFADDVEVRQRAADVARRITEADAAALTPFADELAGVLAAVDPAESRTRSHLALVVARVAHTHEQRMRAARIMKMLARDTSIVVRCSAVEGLAFLAVVERGLRETTAEVVEHVMRSGTKAEQSRAWEAQRRLVRAAAWAGE